MPINRCTLPNGKKGWRYGSQKCFSKREDALKQMRAIKYSQTKSQNKPSIISQVVEYLQNRSNSQND